MREEGRPSRLTGLAAASVEAWTELRIHRTRVLLSLIGVAVAVAALTTTVGIGAIAQQALIESSERSGGRPATLNIQTTTADGTPVHTEQTDAVFARAMKRYDISYSDRFAQTQFNVQFVSGAQQVYAMTVDPDYGIIHRISVQQGRWFTDADSRLLAPAIVVDPTFYRFLGSPDLRTHPTVHLLGVRDQVAVVVGVTSRGDYAPQAGIYILNSAADQLLTATDKQQAYTSYEAWVPLGISDQLTRRITADMQGEIGNGVQVGVGRNDYLAYGGPDPLLPYKLVVAGVAVLILGLGALDLLNISMVTVKQRIREIGIRRSFGATAGRIFFSVMMESIVATLAAGVIGVMLSVAIVENPWVQDKVSGGANDLPGFPIEAALFGIGVAVLVGALAGLLPALVAVRVKVIDAIRF